MTISLQQHNTQTICNKNNRHLDEENGCVLFFSALLYEFSENFSGHFHVVLSNRERADDTTALVTLAYQFVNVVFGKAITVRVILLVRVVTLAETTSRDLRFVLFVFPTRRENRQAR